MTAKPDRLAEALSQLGKHDPFADALRDALTARPRVAVRTRFEIEVVAHLHDTLTDSFTSESEAYETFVRTISILSAFLPDGRRR
jgi:hypothetical protein